MACVFEADGQVLQDGVVLAGLGDFLKRGDQLILCQTGADFWSRRGSATAGVAGVLSLQPIRVSVSKQRASVFMDVGYFSQEGRCARLRYAAG